MYWAALRYVLFLFGFIYWAALNNNKELINAKGITAIVNWFYILFYFVRSIAGHLLGLPLTKGIIIVAAIINKFIHLTAALS